METPDEYAFVRKEVYLDPSRMVFARARVSASHKYELWINGYLADKGPSFAYPSHQYYQESDLSGLLRSGEANVIGVLYHWYGAGQGRPESAPGVIVRMEIEYEDGTVDSIVTDSSWRVRTGHWRSAPLRNDDGSDYVEIIDATDFPAGWSEPGFDDGEWKKALDLGEHPVGPWERLIRQESRVVEKPPISPRVVKLSSGDHVCDFGRVISAFPTVTFKNGEAGRRVRMRAGYRLRKDGSVADDLWSTQETDLSYEYIQRDGEQIFRPFNYLGFRYLQIEDFGEELEDDSVVAIPRYNRVPDEHAASFSSSSKTLDAVWELARHSALHGSQEQFLDTPTREKGQFLMDAFNVSLTAMKAFGERALSRQALQEFAQSQLRHWSDGRLNAVYPNGDGRRDIPDFTVMFPEWMWRYHMETADRDLLEELYPTVRNVAGYAARHIHKDTGLVTNLSGGGGPYLHGIVDWPAEMRYGYDMETVARTTVNVLCLSAIRCTARIAEEIGRIDNETKELHESARKLETAINEWLVRKDGLYVDGLKSDGRMSENASQHANAYPLAFGLVSEDRVPVVANHVVTRKMEMGPMTAYWLLRALDAAGKHCEMVNLLIDTSHDGWANILSRGGTFTWESWLGSEAGHSESHPWGATVLMAMQEILLGVKPTTPGAASLEISPRTGGLAWLEGTIPTERGLVEVRVEDSSEYSLSVEVPEGVSARISIPLYSEYPGNFRITGASPETKVHVNGGNLILCDVGKGSTTVVQGKPKSDRISQ